MIKVLWLPSWYPSIDAVQNGDFIERHALATSRYAYISLFFVQSSSKIEELTRNDSQRNNNFYENIVLFPAVNYLKFINFIRYFVLFNNQLKRLFKKRDLPDLVHVHVSFKAGLIALWLKFRYKLPYILTEHWSYFNPRNKLNYKNDNFLKKYFIKLIFEHASYILPVSNDLNNSLKLYFPNITSSVIPNVVDPNIFNFQTNRHIQPNFKFIHISSMIRLKNPVKIIHAFNNLRKKYQSITLELIGDISSDLIEELRVKGHLNNSIIISGLIEHNCVAIALNGSNAFILFSDYENLPCVIAESLCCGTPVISSSVGGIPEMVNDLNGILVHPGDESALYQAMESMVLNYDKYDRKQISLDAQAKYNPETVGKQIVEIYEKVLAKK